MRVTYTERCWLASRVDEMTAHTLLNVITRASLLKFRRVFVSGTSAKLEDDNGSYLYISVSRLLSLSLSLSPTGLIISRLCQVHGRAWH